MAIPKTQSSFGYIKGNPDIVKFNPRPVPVPKENEVLLKVEAAGLCMSDPHLLIGGALPSIDDRPEATEFVMGHEIAGSIAAVGDNLKSDPNYGVGSRFSLTIAITCGKCVSCRSGLDSACDESSQAYGLNEHGGFQEYLLVKNLRTLIPIPDSVGYEVAAVSTDSVLTPFHAINKVKHLFYPTTKVLVVGLGGLGLNALQILRNYGVHVVGVDVKESLKEVALKNGANEFYTDLYDSEHGMESFHFCFDFVGIQPSSDLCQAFVKRQGKIVSVGLGRSKLFIKNFELARREAQYIFCFGGTSAEQIELMEWIKLGKLNPPFTVVNFSELPKYLHALHEGKVQGRIVFRPSKL